MTNLRLSIAFLWIASPLWAEAVTVVEPTQIAPDLSAHVSFDSLPRQDEPGLNFDAALRFLGVWIGEHLAGQTVTGTPHDALTGPPATAQVQPGLPGQNLSVAYHRGFGSNAVFPLGPAGFPALEARGEGAVAIQFDQPQRILSLAIHTDYVAPLGSTPRPQGTVTLTFYAPDARLLDQITLSPGPGATIFGFATTAGLPEIGALTITNTDPGGIAIDDLRFQIAPLLG